MAKASLEDMEELIASIVEAKVANYMREALACYGAGAFRGCIVLSYIAAFEDLRNKLEELAKTDSKAKKIWKKIKTLVDGQKPFEKTMLEQLASVGLILKSDAKRLQTVIDYRNAAAHPSGSDATAEQARMVFSEVIRTTLAKPALRTQQAADRIIERTDTANLFPTDDPDDIASISVSERKALHPSALPYLLEKLTADYKGWATHRRKNTRHLLFGLAAEAADESRAELVKRIIVPHANDNGFKKLILGVISADGKVLQGIDGPTTLRIGSLLDAARTPPITVPQVDPIHPINLAASLLKSFDPGGAPFVDSFVKAALNANSLNGRMIENAIGTSWETTMIDIWCERAGSSTFDIANPISRQVEVIDAHREAFSDEQAFRFIARVISASMSNAWGAKALVTGSFDSAPGLLDKARRFASEHEADADAISEAEIYSDSQTLFSQYVDDGEDQDDDADVDDGDAAIDENEVDLEI